MPPDLALAETAPEQAALFAAEDLPTPEARSAVYQSIYVHFETLEDLRDFGRLVGLPLTSETTWLRFPIEHPSDLGTAEDDREEADPLADVDELLAEADLFEAPPGESDLVPRLAVALRRAVSLLAAYSSLSGGNGSGAAG